MAFSFRKPNSIFSPQSTSLLKFKIILLNNYLDNYFMRKEQLHDEHVEYPVSREFLSLREPNLFPLRPETELRLVTLDLERSKPNSSVTGLDSPEAKSLLGCFEMSEGGLVFVPGRLHLGALREFDTKTAIFQIMSLPDFRNWIEPFSTEQTITVSILREGMFFNLAQNLLLASHFQVGDQVTISVHHLQDPSGHLGLKSEVDYYRHESSPHEAEEVKSAIIGDSIAGGRNILAMLEKVSVDFPNLERLTVVSVHASLKGIERILEGLPGNIQGCRFFCLNGVLAASLKNHYDCFLPVHRPGSLPDPRDVRLMETIYGSAIFGRICVGGNWTANYLTPLTAKRVLEEQLAPMELTSQQIPVSEVNEQTIWQLGYRIDELTPYSTLLSAKK